MQVGITRLLLAVTALIGCRGEAPRTQNSIEGDELRAMVESLMPAVARAAGMEFLEVPQSAVRTRDELREFLISKLDEDLPPERLDGIVGIYRLLGLLPDTLDLRQLFVDLYTEQVAGYYDPATKTLYAMAGSGKEELRLTLAHELVHALQGQHLPLDSMLRDRSDADRTAALQAVLEGHATIASIFVLAPDNRIVEDDATWELMREQFSAPRPSMASFNSAPLVIRTGLLFPYVEGTGFMRWLMRNHPGASPFDALLPQSTEQVIHPERIARGDGPVAVSFVDDSTDVLHDDTFGEYEMLVLRASLAGITAVVTDIPLGWGGDRLRLYRSGDGNALVWYTVWDDDRSATNFRTRIVNGLERLGREGYRTAIEAVDVSGRPGVRVVIAPAGWDRWDDLPEAVAEGR